MSNVSINERKAISLVAAGAALTVTLVAIYLLCFLSAFLLPNMLAPHAWLGLFTTAPPLSAAGLIGGIVSNVVFAWIAAVLFVPTYNRLSHVRH